MVKIKLGRVEIIVMLGHISMWCKLQHQKLLLITKKRRRYHTRKIVGTNKGWVQYESHTNWL